MGFDGAISLERRQKLYQRPSENWRHRSFENTEAPREEIQKTGNVGSHVGNRQQPPSNPYLTIWKTSNDDGSNGVKPNPRTKLNFSAVNSGARPNLRRVRGAIWLVNMVPGRGLFGRT